jgi:sporulation protein YlmC with PRC-barrel domain
MPTPSGHTTAICAKTVIGTAVKDATGDKIGKIEDIVLDKTTNNIMFAVVGFGGVLGMGEKFHPVPWASLDFEESENAYVVNKSKDELKAAPADSMDILTRGDGSKFRDSAYDYYGAQRYWS